jgi:hypothetical protein
MRGVIAAACLWLVRCPGGNGVCAVAADGSGGCGFESISGRLRDTSAATPVPKTERSIFQRTARLI